MSFLDKYFNNKAIKKKSLVQLGPSNYYDHIVNSSKDRNLIPISIKKKRFNAVIHKEILKENEVNFKRKSRKYWLLLPIILFIFQKKKMEKKCLYKY